MLHRRRTPSRKPSDRLRARAARQRKDRSTVLRGKRAAVSFGITKETQGEVEFRRAIEEESMERFMNAFVSLRLASEHGHAGATNALGLYHATGKHGKRDPKAAIAAFKTAAQLGHDEAAVNLAAIYVDKCCNTKKAVELLQGPVSRGHADARYFMARTRPSSDGTAFDLLLLACKQGHVLAMLEIAERCLEMSSRPDRFKIAITWARKAGTLGNTQAFFCLRNILKHGESADEDKIAAHDAMEMCIDHALPSENHVEWYAESIFSNPRLLGDRVERLKGMAEKGSREAAHAWCIAQARGINIHVHTPIPIKSPECRKFIVSAIELNAEMIALVSSMDSGAVSGEAEKTRVLLERIPRLYYDVDGEYVIATCSKCEKAHYLSVVFSSASALGRCPSCALDEVSESARACELCVSIPERSQGVFIDSTPYSLFLSPAIAHLIVPKGSTFGAPCLGSAIKRRPPCQADLLSSLPMFEADDVEDEDEV